MTDSNLEADRDAIALRQYTQALQSVLMDFQYIEEGLRSYVAEAYETIRRRVADVLPFHATYQDLERDALGRLIDKFSQLSNNDGLVKELRRLQPLRNHCAHRGLLLSASEQRDVAYLDAERLKLEETKTKTRECVLAVLKEWGAIVQRRSGEHAATP